MIDALIDKIVDVRLGASPDLNLHLNPVGPSSFPHNPSCWAADLDFTCHSVYTDYSDGGGDSDKRTITMVTPRHGICASHFGVGTPLYFADRSGNIITRTANGVVDVGGDIRLVQLNTDLPAGFTFARIMPTNYSSYITSLSGKPVVYLMAARRVGGFPTSDGLNHDSIHVRVAELASFGTSVFMEPASAGDRADVFKYPYSGDSGNPMFLFVDEDVPVLLTHFFGATGGPSVYYYANAVNAAIAAFPSNGGYSLTPINLAAYEATPKDVIVLYRENDADSLDFAESYSDLHPNKLVQTVSVPCSEDEILSDHSQFRTEISNTLSTALLRYTCNNILVGYGVPGGFLDGDDIISTTSRLSRINSTYEKNVANPLYNRQRFSSYDAADADYSLIVSRIDAPTLDMAKAILTESSVVAKQGKANGIFYFDPYAPLVTDADDTYQQDLFDFEDEILPILNIRIHKSTFWDEYTDSVIPHVTDDSFLWTWKTDRAGLSYFKNKTTARVFAYNADADGAETVRDINGRRWPTLALASSYVASAGAMSDTTSAGHLRPKPFFNALFRGATIGEAFLFACPFLDSPMTLFGDPLLTVAFPSGTTPSDSPTVDAGWDSMGQDLQSACGYLMEREQFMIDTFLQLINTQDVTVLGEVMGPFSRAGNSVIAKTRNYIARTVQAYLRFPLNSQSLTTYLTNRGVTVSSLLPLMTKETLASSLLSPSGSWFFSSPIAHESGQYATYRFEIQVSFYHDFSTTYLSSLSQTDTGRWTYEKQSNSFVAVPVAGVPSSYAGRLVRFTPSAEDYFSERDIYYVRIRQINEFDERTDWVTVRQVVGT